MEKGTASPDTESGYILLVKSWEKFHRDFEGIFEKYSKNRSIKIMQGLLRYNGILNMYKKKVLEERISSYEPESMTDGPNKIGNIKKFILKIGFILYPWYMLAKKISLNPFKKYKKEFKLAISIDQPKNILSRNYYGEDILIGGEIKKTDVLIIDEHRKNNTEKYKKLGFYSTSIMNSRETIGFSMLGKILFKFLPVWIKTLFSIGDDFIIYRTSCKILTEYLLWNMFVENYKVKRYIRRMTRDSISKISIKI